MEELAVGSRTQQTQRKMATRKMYNADYTHTYTRVHAHRVRTKSIQALFWLLYVHSFNTHHDHSR